MFNSDKKYIFWGAIVGVMIFIFVFGVYLGYNNRPSAEKILSVLNKKTPATMQEVDFNAFWNAWNNVESKYVSSGGLNRQELVWGAISGLVNSLDDPYSVFFPPTQAEIFESSVRGDFGGVGMEIGMKDSVLTVIAPLKGTPAERAGIKAGDKILKINATSTIDLNVDEAVSMIRGEKGTTVTLLISRDGIEEPFSVEVVRATIEIPVLETAQKSNGVFVITLYNFSARSGDLFRSALRKMIDSGSSKLIIDMRGNPGGYLDAAVEISSWFLPMGEVVVREQFGNGEEEVYRSKGYDIFDKLPLVILVNQGSASASEIVAGALKDHGKATVVGEKTFGKGSVQELIPMDKGSSLKLTIARWLTPNGNSISKEGIEPDVKVELTKEDFEASRDPQMDKALEILNK